MDMKPMGGSGIKLTTGEVIGRWSLDDHDGKRERVGEGAEAPGSRRLPAALGASGASRRVPGGSQGPSGELKMRLGSTLGKL